MVRMESVYVLRSRRGSLPSQEEPPTPDTPLHPSEVYARVYVRQKRAFWSEGFSDRFRDKIIVVLRFPAEDL